jgi:hypothetical protein
MHESPEGLDQTFLIATVLMPSVFCGSDRMNLPRLFRWCRPAPSWGGMITAGVELHYNHIDILLHQLGDMIAAQVAVFH